MNLFFPSLSWFKRLGSHSSKLNIKPANDFVFALERALQYNIREEYEGPEAFGKWQLFETQEKKVSYT